jgi:hypothetical protein
MFSLKTVAIKIVEIYIFFFFEEKCENSIEFNLGKAAILLNSQSLFEYPIPICMIYSPTCNLFTNRKTKVKDSQENFR